MQDHLQRHKENLQCFCRLCGTRNLGARTGAKESFQAEILSGFNLDITQDNHIIHPSTICFSCLKKLYLTRSAIANDKTYCPQDTAVHQFSEHAESCSICQDLPETRPAQRGRPAKKKRGGKRNGGKPVSAKTPTPSPHIDSFDSLQHKLFRIPLNCIPYNWGISKNSDYVILTQVNGVPIPMITTSIELTEDKYTIYVRNRPLPEEHQIYTTRSRKITSLQQLTQILDDIENFTVCNGNPDPEFVKLFINKEPVPSKLGYREDNFSYKNHDDKLYTATVRTKTCGLFTHKLRCNQCIEYRKALHALTSKDRMDKSQKDTSKINYRFLSKDDIKAQLKEAKQLNESATEEIERLRKILDGMIVTEGVEIGECVSKDLSSVLTSGSPFPEDSLNNLFWEQQVKACNVKNARCVRWHPTIIKWCLNLNMVSRKAYQTIAESGALRLPSIRTLQDYSQYIRVKSGIQPEVMAQLKEQATAKGIFEGLEFKRYVVVLLDEMKIKKDLVYDKHNGELIGFTNLGDINEELNIAEKATNKMASHMMAVMVRAICADFKFQLAHFPVATATASDLFPIIWEVIEHLELSGFKVLALTCDGASINRRLFKMHRIEGTNTNCMTYSTPNVFAEDERPLYFIADPPHLLKTARNCWSNSYSHKMSRKMWNDGYDISWMHLVDLFSLELKEDRNLRMAHKLKAEHVNLTSFSLMRVRLAAQVLSSTVAKAMKKTGGQKVAGTVKFIEMFDRWFDCMNVRSTKEGSRKLKPDCQPYRDIHDTRFEFLCTEFEDYLTSWEESVANRPGDLTQGQRNQMMLSRETIEGLRITCRAFVGAAKHLLAAGAPFVLSEHFCQDLIEQEFSKHRHHGGANDNPSVQGFNYQSASLRVQGGFGSASKIGNTTVTQGTAYQIDETPLKKRPRKK